MIKRLIAALVALSLGLALSLVGATAAQAHTGDLGASSVCQSDGTYKITYTLTVAQTTESGATKWSIGTTSFAHTPTSNADLPGTVQPGTVASTGTGAYVLGTTTIPGSSTTAPWAYAYTIWTPDNYQKGSDGGDISLDGTCGDTPDTTKITFCHYDDGEGGKYTSNTTSVAAFYKAGHLDHSKDIFPAGSITKKGVVHSWAAQGDQSLLAWKNCAAVDAAAAVTVSTPTCQSASVATWTGLVSATGGALNQTIGTHSGIATATANHTFPAGAGVSSNGKTKTVSYTIAPAIIGQPCWPTDATASVTTAQPSCTVGASFTGVTGANVSNHTVQGPTSGPGTVTVTFTAASGHKFPAGQNVSADGSTYTVAVVLAGPDASKCPTVVPQAPVVQDLCGTTNDQYGLPTGPHGVTYSRDGLNIVATHGANLNWGTLPAGWVLNQNGTASYAFTNTTWTDVSCYPPQACSVTGAPYTEDGFPAFTVDGQDYEGGAGHAMNWLVPTSGNLQGFTTASFTVTAATGYHVGYRFVLYSQGTTGYTSVTAEPYLNGWVAGQTGTFTITPSTLVWNSHISSGPGSQSSPITLTAMAALIPANQLISQGLHYGSTEPAGARTVVSQITGCVSYDKPIAVTPMFPEQTGPTCDVAGSLPALPTDQTGITFVWNGLTMTATADKGYAFADGVPTSKSYSSPAAALGYQSNNVEGNCYRAPTTVPSSVSHTDQTCSVGKPIGGVITVGTEDHVSYQIKDALHNVVPFDNTGKTDQLAPGTYTVTATADTGYSLDPDVSGPVTITGPEGGCGRVESSVAASAHETDQSCSVDSEVPGLVNGYITVGIATGVSYRITKDSDSTHTPIPFDSVSGKTGALATGNYTVHPSAQPGFTLADSADIPLTIAAYDGLCGQLVTHPLVDPSAAQAQITCNASGSYTLSSDQTDAEAVVWTVNGSPVSQGKYTVATAGHYVIDAAPGAGFGFADGTQTHWVFDFAVATCSLTTLALTGSNPTGILVLAGFLTLFGLALLRRAGQVRKTARP